MFSWLKPKKRAEVIPAGMTDPQDIERLLAQAAHSSAHILIVALDGTRFGQGCLSSVTDEMVIATLVEAGDQRHYHPATLCCVSFSHGGRARVFLSRVERHERSLNDGESRLLLEFPRQVASMQGRMAHRIPVRDASSLETWLNDGDKTWSVRTKDISMTGILVVVEGDDPDWSADKQMKVVLKHRDAVARVDGVVRRIDPDGTYGLMFPKVLAVGKFAPPEPLRQIVHALEKEFVGGVG